MQQRRAMSSVLEAWGPVANRCWDAITSGRFFSWWSVLASLPVALLLLSLGLHTAADPRQAGVALVLNAVGWVVCCLLLVPAALAERRLRRPTARGVTVLGALLVVAVLRPHLNDLLAAWFTDWPAAAGLPVRTVMSVVVWSVLLIAIAVAVDASDTANHVNRRLRAALAALAGGDVSAGLQAREARARVSGIVDDLRARVAALRTGIVDFDRVREFSDAVREASHSLDEYADQGLPTGAIRTRPSFFERLRPPPVGLVPIITTFSTLPFTFHLPPLLIVTWAVLVFVVGTVCELIAWLLTHGRSSRAQGRIVVCEAIAAGAAIPLTLLLVAGYWEVTWILPGEVVIVLTLLAAFARAAFDRADAEQRVLTEALGQIRAAGSGAVAPTADYVHRAADTLHGPVQGRCVVFAATLEDDPATPEQVEAFIRSVGERLDLVLAPQTELADPRSALIDAWSPVLRIRTDADPSAAAALATRATSQRVADIASEAFVNAVKHSAAKEAEVTVRGVDDGMLEVRVATPGRLRSRRRGGTGLGRLGVPTRLVQEGDRVVLTAVVPIDGATIPGVVGGHVEGGDGSRAAG